MTDSLDAEMRPTMEAYGGTIALYEKTGYELVAKIVEDYKPGDDKLIFAKTLPAPTASVVNEMETKVIREEPLAPALSAS